MPYSRTEAYKATFRRHRILFSLPVVIAIVVAGWSVLGAPKSYQSSASLWIDNAAPLGSSLNPVISQATPPSTAEQTVLDELLTTASFIDAVGKGSGLDSYLETNQHSGFGPAALLSRLSGSPSMQSQLESELGSEITSAVTGPQILQIGYTGPTPELARSVLATLVKELQSSTKYFAQQYSTSEANYYQAQVTAAQEALNAARQQASSYLAAHPGASSSAGTIYSSLLAAVSTAGTQLTQATANLRNAQTATTNSEGTISTLIDPATLPTAPTSGKKKEVEGVVGGVFAGMVISLLAIVLMTPGGLGQWQTPESGAWEPAPRSRSSLASGREPSGLLVAPGDGRRVRPVSTVEPPPDIDDGDASEVERRLARSFTGLRRRESNR